MMKLKTLIATFMLFCGLVVSAPMARASSVAPAPAAITAVTETSEAAEIEQLEQREQAAQELEDFEGGDAIVITGSALAIALLVVLIFVVVAD